MPPKLTKLVISPCNAPGYFSAGNVDNGQGGFGHGDQFAQATQTFSEGAGSGLAVPGRDEEELGVITPTADQSRRSDRYLPSRIGMDPEHLSQLHRLMSDQSHIRVTDDHRTIKLPSQASSSISSPHSRVAITEGMDAMSVGAHQSDLASTRSTYDYSQQFHDDDFVVLRRLGEGASGTVDKVKHLPSGRIMARKTIFTAAQDTDVHKQILREISFLQSCHSVNIVKYYGAYLHPPPTSSGPPEQIRVLMEYCAGTFCLEGLIFY